MHKSASALLVTPHKDDPILKLANDNDIWLRKYKGKDVFYVKVSGEWVKQHEKSKDTA